MTQTAHWSVDVFGAVLSVKLPTGETVASVRSTPGRMELISGPGGVVSFDAGAAAAVGDALARFARLGTIGPPTSVVSVRGRTADELAAAGVVYVGRTVRGRKSPLDPAAVTLAGHPIANPYKLPKGAGRDTRATCVAVYREWLRGDPGRVELARALRGRVLGCWCLDWPGYGPVNGHCHAVEIARVAEEG